ncbi:MAG: secondary thiamine-phosphate synthase enzyme YjbQ [Victivallales bacterium]|nr:secondary thiamine-phosphate synthase enzyme YjbQ [Victivallales bacterium]
MKKIGIKSSKHSEMIDITRQLDSLIPAGFTSGLCHVFCPHTTAGLTVNENADPDVRRDLLAATERIVPWNDPLFRHFEGNSAAHLKASLMGFSQSIPVAEGKLCLGTWQGVYFCEFDGPRNREVRVQFFRDSDADE